MKGLNGEKRSGGCWGGAWWWRRWMRWLARTQHGGHRAAKETVTVRKVSTV